MDVYSAPEGIDPPDFNAAFVNGRYDHELSQKLDEEYFVALEAKLREMGWNGKRTGKLVYFGVADGAATYMVAEGKNRKPCLIHCEVGDAWSLPVAQLRGYTKTEINKMVDAPKIFGARGPSGHR